jgi:opacity protein-like surface antigen
MNTRKIILTLVAALLLSLNCHAGWYLRGGIMYNSLEDIRIKEFSGDYKAGLDSSIGFNAAAGYRFALLRGEAEIHYLSAGIRDTGIAQVTTSGDFQRTSLFANLYMDFPFTFLIEPYLGAGIGISKVKVDIDNLFAGEGAGASFSSSADDRRFSYQLMAGLRFNVFETISIHAGYRYLNVDALSFAEGDYQLESKNGSHILEVGLGFGF